MKLTGHYSDSKFLEYIFKNANMDTYANIFDECINQKIIINSKLALD
tara:strand:- start:582 stop:722 length:141 start_codon:yes stop_codon:yes gene_type:complete